MVSIFNIRSAGGLLVFAADQRILFVSISFQIESHFFYSYTRILLNVSTRYQLFDMKFCVSLSCCFPRRQSPPASPYFVEFQVFPFSLPRVSLVPTISRVISNPPTSTIRGGRRSLEELGVDILVEVEDNFMCHSEQISKEDIDNIRENIPACLDNNSLSSQHSIVRGDEASQLIAEHQDLQEMVTFTNNQSFVELKVSLLDYCFVCLICLFNLIFLYCKLHFQFYRKLV